MSLSFNPWVATRTSRDPSISNPGYTLEKLPEEILDAIIKDVAQDILSLAQLAKTSKLFLRLALSDRLDIFSQINIQKRSFWLKRYFTTNNEIDDIPLIDRVFADVMKRSFSHQFAWETLTMLRQAQEIAEIMRAQEENLDPSFDHSPASVEYSLFCLWNAVSAQLEWNKREFIPPNALHIDKWLNNPKNCNRLGLLENLAICRGMRCISTTVSKFKALVYLDLRSNKLSDLPDKISKLDKLEELILTNNWFSKIPEAIRKMPQLKILQLNSNHFLTTLPEWLEELPQLQVEVRDCPIAGPLPYALKLNDRILYLAENVAYTDNPMIQTAEKIGFLISYLLIFIVSNISVQSFLHNYEEFGACSRSEETYQCKSAVLEEFRQEFFPESPKMFFLSYPPLIVRSRLTACNLRCTLPMGITVLGISAFILFIGLTKAAWRKYK